MNSSGIRFCSFPRTDPPPIFIDPLIEVFRRHEATIATLLLPKGLTSDVVLATLRNDLVALGFHAEAGKAGADRIDRPVFFGEDGRPTLRYKIDAYHPAWRCGLEIEAGRAWMGNAVYRDLVQAMVMVQVDHLCLAVPNGYRYKNKGTGRDTISADFKNTIGVADALFGHNRVRIPYGLTVIGY